MRAAGSVARSQAGCRKRLPACRAAVWWPGVVVAGLYDFRIFVEK